MCVCVCVCEREREREREREHLGDLLMAETYLVCIIRAFLSIYTSKFNLFYSYWWHRRTNYPRAYRTRITLSH